MEIIVACMPCGCRAIATTEKLVRSFHMGVLMMLRVQLAHVKWYMGRVVVTCEGVILLNKLIDHSFSSFMHVFVSDSRLLITKRPVSAPLQVSKLSFSVSSS